MGVSPEFFIQGSNQNYFHMFVQNTTTGDVYVFQSSDGRGIFIDLVKPIRVSSGQTVKVYVSNDSVNDTDYYATLLGWLEP